MYESHVYVSCEPTFTPWLAPRALKHIYSLITLRHDSHSQQPLNFERKKSYTLHIEGMNTHADPRFSYLGSFKDTATLKITVGDVDEGPVFSIDHYIMDVYENAPRGTEVGAVTARDPDSRNSPVRWDFFTTDVQMSTKTGSRNLNLPFVVRLPPSMKHPSTQEDSNLISYLFMLFFNFKVWTGVFYVSCAV